MIRLLLTAFVLRALIPAGFMPDFGAAANGVFKIVICTASGTHLVTVDADGQPVKGGPASDQKAQHHDEPCAFAALAIVAAAPLDFSHLIVPQRDAGSEIVSTNVMLPPARAGPPLGSRGPPLFS